MFLTSGDDSGQVIAVSGGTRPFVEREECPAFLCLKFTVEVDVVTRESASVETTTFENTDALFSLMNVYAGVRGARCPMRFVLSDMTPFSLLVRYTSIRCAVMSNIVLCAAMAD